MRAARHGGDFVDSYRREWVHFLAVARGEEEPGCTLEDGRRSLAVLLAVLQAAEEGRTVPVAPTPAALPPEART